MIQRGCYYVIDIEADGLLETATQIWCIAYRALNGENTQVVRPGDTNFFDVLDGLSQCEGIIGHNLIAYDLPLIKKLHGRDLKVLPKVIDTLVMSRVLNSDMPMGHSLANWMRLLNLKDKIVQENWETFDENMLVRCKEDTEATESVFNYLIKTYYINPLDFPDFLKREHLFAEICYQITSIGLYLDVEKVESYISKLESEISEIDLILKPKLGERLQEKPALKNILKKDGTPSIKMQSWIDSGNPYEIIADRAGKPQEMRRWIAIDNSPSSPNVLRNYLLSLGWKPRDDPDAWNYKQIKTPYGKLIKLKDVRGNLIRTTPKLPTDSNELVKLQLINDDFALVAQRLERSHRMNTLNGYLMNYDRKTSRIHMGINPCGAVTSRVTHSVVANIPRVGSFFGKEMRSIFRASPGKVLVGCDMSGLELRVLAHYLKNERFSNMILHGDIHTYLFEKLEKYVVDRSSAKNLTYAFLYGAGNVKLGSMCNKITNGDLMELGKGVRNVYLEHIPNLAALLKQLEQRVTKTGGFKGLDGRHIRCRNAYSALNTLCQSAGSILAKEWTNLFYMKGLPGNIIAYMHDELIIESEEKEALQIGEALVESIKDAGKVLKLNIELDGEFKIGQDWSEIH